MDVDSVSYAGLGEADLVLPYVDPIYLSGIKNADPKIYIGLADQASTISYTNEKKELKPGTLPFYAQFYNGIELHSTFESMPEKKDMEKLYNIIQGADFRFCPKIFKGINQLVDKTKVGLTLSFIDKVRSLKDKLGTTFIELNGDAESEHQDRILAYFRELPKDFRLAIEVVHRSWFEYPDRFAAFVKELHLLNKGTIIDDHPGRRDAVHMQLSNATAFIRFACIGDHALDLFRIEQWKMQIRSWFRQGLEECYFMLHVQDKKAEQDLGEYVRAEFEV